MRNFLVFLIFSITQISLSGQVDFCSQPLDISGWRQEGDPNQNWVFRADGQGGRQTYNGIPMYLFSGQDYINVKISGTMEVDDYTYSTWVDNDFIGFVLGAVGPNNSNGTLHQYYLIDWNGRDNTGTAGGGDVANSGINLFDVNTNLTDPLVHEAQLSSMFWSHNNWPNEFVRMQHGSNQTWSHQVVYDFEVYYTSTNVKVVIDGGVFNNDTILDVDGCFRPGEFGFYNYSQASALYGDLTIKNIADFDLSSDSICVGEEFTFSAAGCQGSGYYNDHPDISLDWLVDDSIAFTGAEVDYTFDVVGTHKVRLIVGNSNSCNDTAIKFIEVEGPPTISIEDFTICPDEDSTLTIPGFATYNWYMDASGNQASFTIQDTGTFALEITSNLGCTFSDTFSVAMDDIPNIDVGSDFELCFGADSLITASTNGVNIEWSNGTSDPNCLVQAGQVYIAEAINASGCSNFDTLNVSMICCDENRFEKDTVIVCEGEVGQNRLLGNLDNLIWLDSNLISVLDSGKVSFTGNQDGYVQVLKRKVGENAINNGDFELGNTGFSSQYVVDCIPMMSQGAYCVDDNPNNHNGAFANMGDHTTGSGLMFVSDGSPIANRNIWCQEISITPNTNYEFSTWLATVYSPNPAQLQFSVEGNLLGQIFTAPSTAGVWQEYSAQWNSGNLEQATMCIVNQNTAGSGNDFAIDDISFRPVCIEKDSFFIDVKSPTEFDLGNDTSFCEGESLELEGVQGCQHRWNTGDTTNNIFVDTSGLFKLTLTNQFGCVSSDSLEVTINQNPTPNLGLDTAICMGDSFEKSVNSGASWEWNTGSTAQSIIINSSGEYWVQVTDANNCIGMDSFVVAMHQLPQPNLGNDTLICAYDSVELNANAIGTYVWNTGDTNPSIWVNTQNEYYVTVTDSNQCVNHDTIQITIPDLIRFSLANDTNVCDGVTKELQVNEGVEWLWSTGEISQNIMVSQEGEYTVTATDSYGCMASDTFYLGVHDLPTPDLGSDFGICADVDTVLELSDEFMNYLWNDSLVGTYQYPISNHPSGIIEVTVTDSNGCVASDEINFTTYPAVEIQVAERDSFCAESILEVKSKAILGTAPYNYRWSTGSTNRYLNVSTPNEYVVSVEDVYGCADADTITVVEMPLPEVNIGDAYETCMNETVAISNQGDTSSLNNYRWNISRINAPQMIYQPYASGEETVILQVTSPFGCMASDSAVIESIALPYPYLGPDKVVCFDSTTTLQAEVETSLVETSLLWSNGTMGVQSSVSNDGSYVLTANHRGCIQKDSIMVEFVSIPEINMGALLGDSIFCFESLENEVLIQPYETRPEARYSYRWADGIYGFSREVEEEGIYIIEVSEKGCAKSGSIQIIDYCEPRLAIPNAFSPNDDGLNDVFMPYSEFVTTFEMYIFNRWGEQIFSTTDPNEGWNGRHQNTGQKSQVDVYVYKIVYDTFDVAGNIERIEKVGHVTLLK